MRPPIAPRPLPPLTYPPDLPISARREEILAALRASRVVVVCGETGSGKTTQLPKLLLEAGALGRGVIGHTQPRRIAARSVAARLAAELPGAPPQFVGHKVRFNDGTARDTAIKVMTDGILLAEARHDPLLRRYDALIIDEAHERSLNIDFLLGFLQRLMVRRRDLRLVITSATIDPQRFADFFGGAPVIEVSGRGYPVETRYRPLEADADDRFDPGLVAGVLGALDEIRAEPGEIGRGDVLVFLPGEREIREVGEAIEQAHGNRLAVLPLYSRLAWADQQRVFERRGPQRVVLATNVAETSLTVPGIRAVIDSGLARISRYSPRTKILRLPIEPISQASARQRQGRCGRTGAGLCIRLYSEVDFEARDAFTAPEVLRTNLASVILQMEVLGLGSPVDFPFLDPPDTRLVTDGYKLLQELEAVDDAQQVTEAGRQMARLPVDPRLARVLLAARRHGTLREALRLAAGLSIQDPRERPSEKTEAADAAHAEGADGRSDFLTLLGLWDRYQAERAARTRSALRRWCADRFLSAARMREWEELEAQLREAVAEFGWTPNEEPASPEAVHRTLLSGFLGQVGTKTERGDFLGPRGRRFLIAPGTPLRNRAPRWIVAAQIVETQRVYARLVAAVEPAWIEAAAHHLLRREYTEPEWDEVRGIVTCRESVSLYGLVLAAGRRVHYGTVAPVPAREMFVREALVHGRSRLRARFLERNAALKARLRAEEAALRRHVVLVDEAEEGQFYLARLPAEAVSLAAFERWRREAERATPALLEMAPEDLRRADAPRPDPVAYPTALAVAGNRLPLEYRFDPLDPADGATLLVPEPLLSKLSRGELDWGVPGWRADKVAALIRGLPKSLRRRLVPAPDVARSALAELATAGNAPFHEALAAVLTRLGGEPVSADLLAGVELEPYLRVNLRILAADGRVLAEGRDLAHLQREQRRGAGPLGARPAANGTDPWERAEVRDFDFGVLPESIEVVRQGVRLTLHPALADAGTHARLHLVADAREAEDTTRQGLVRLLALNLVAPLKHAQKGLAADRDLVLGHQPFGPGRDFLRAIAERALERECLPPGSVLPRTREAFDAALERGRPGLVPTAERLGGALRLALADARLAREELSRLPPSVDATLAADVRAQLAGLLHEGFLEAMPDPWLDGLGRYVKALRRRIAKLPGAHGAVAAAQRELAEARRRHAALKARLAPGLPVPAPLLELRWLVEEYGVQLFAQDLRTRVPVSAKRLAAAEALASASLR